MKVTIVGGGGGVGASTAFNLIVGGGDHDLVIVDSRPTAVTSHVMDLEQVLELRPGSTLRGGIESDIADADVCVIAAAAPLAVNTTRLAYLFDNAAIVDSVVDVLPPGWPGVLIVVTNPVDPLVTRIQQRTGIDRRRVVGYTLNDSLRFRTGLGNALGVDAGSVDAWVLGEHGDACVPLHDRVTVDGSPVRPTPEQAAAAEEFLRTWYRRHVALDSGRSSTWTSGLGIARMVEALSDGDESIWPASIVLVGEYGIHDVALTVPVTLGRRGVVAIHEWPLSDDDLDALASAAEVVRQSTASIDARPVSRGLM